MKSKFLRSVLSAATAVVMLACAAGTARAAVTNHVFYAFDTEGDYTNDLSATRLYGWWSAAQSWVLSWTAGPTNQFDPTLNSNGGAPGSGSLRLWYWEATDPGAFQQNFDFVNLVTTPGAPNFGPINFARDFAYGALDIRFDPSSPLRTNGDYGEYFVISITLRTNPDLSTTEDWDDVFRLNPSPADAGRWVTYKGSPVARQTNVVAFFTGLQGSGYTNADPIIVNVDNLRFFSTEAAPATNLVIYPFDTEGEYTNDLTATRLYGWWSAAQSWVLSWTTGPTNQYDALQDANLSPGSGSLRLWYNENPDPGAFQQNFDFVNLVTTPGVHNFGPINFNHDFAYGAMDIKFDPSSPIRTNGDYGEYFVIAITLRTNPDLSTTEDWDDIFRLNPSPADAGRWVTYQGPAVARQTNVVAFFTGLQGGGYTSSVPIIVNVDNLRFTSPPAPPPTLSIQKAAGGIEFAPAATPARSDAAPFMMSVANAYLQPALDWMSYLDSGTASHTRMSYDLTIGDFPDASHSGFVAHLILAPYGTTPEGWRTHPEVDLANAVYVTITNNPDGSATGNLMYKVNAATSNNLWTTLGTISSPSAIGTWSLVCETNSLKLKAPGGGNGVGGTISDSDLANFDPGQSFTPMRIWYGVQPRVANNFGQIATFSSFNVSYLDSITGVTVVTNENWTDSYQLNYIEASDCVGILPRPANTAWRLSWNGPSVGFALQQSSSLPGSWTSSGFPVGTSNSRKVSFVPGDALPSASKGFYRLYNPTP